MLLCISIGFESVCIVRWDVVTSLLPAITPNISSTRSPVSHVLCEPRKGWVGARPG